MRKINTPKPMSKNEYTVSLCRLIGINTLEDLQHFKRNYKRANETMTQALERYFNNILNEE